MQKLITVSVDTKLITKNPGSPFTINEVESLNEWLSMGWEIEEWDFLKEGEDDGEIVLLVILNDDALYDDEDDFDEEFIGDDEEIDDDDDDDEEEDEDSEKKNPGMN